MDAHAKGGQRDSYNFEVSGSFISPYPKKIANAHKNSPNETLSLLSEERAASI
jgi:hypothetical protein